MTTILALLVRVPEPATATLLAALGGAGATIHFVRAYIKRSRSRND